VTTATSTSPATAPARGPGPAVSLRGLVKWFDDVLAVDRVDLDIARGEFFSMLGPSGSGKTTVLRLIGGFEKPTSGRIELDGADVTGLAPFERNLTTVFQDYALFPHLSVLDNVAYGLRVRGMARAERRERAAAALVKVALHGLEKRRPAQLSGGQRQRVALARALVVDPSVLLLDEPLGALDLKLREQMQVELKQIQRDVGITFVFVTHDQEEALTMSDRVAVFDSGRIQQVGTPQDIYERPASRFVAGFVGTSNVLAGGVARSLLGREGTFTVRPEKLRILVGAAGPGRTSGDVVAADGRIDEVVYAGPVTRYLVELDAGARLTAVLTNGGDVTSGQPGIGGGVRPGRGDRVRLLVARHDIRELTDEPPGAPASGTVAAVERNRS
jgi:putative spermidine/putrescine transport system ATP-binding protein